MLEQRVAETKQRLEKLQEKQRELFAARRIASLRILSHSNAIIWEKAKQRYRHKIDENGMRTVLLIGALFAALVLPFAFFAAIFDGLVLGTNSRFTSSALQLAEVNHCACIDESNFEDFVYGRIFQRVGSLSSQEARRAVTFSSTSSLNKP